MIGLIGLSVIEVKAQLVKKNINIYFTAGISNTLGDQLFQDGSFSTDAFFPNLNKGSGFEVSMLWKKWKYIGIGGQIGVSNFSDWNMDTTQFFNGASVKLVHFSPLIRLYTPLSQTTIMNKLQIYLQFAPGYSLTKLNLPQAGFDINAHGSTVTIPEESKTSAYGYAVSVGIDYSVNQMIGFCINVTHNSTVNNSSFLFDKKFNYLKYSAGIFVKIAKNKRYYNTN